MCDHRADVLQEAPHARPGGMTAVHPRRIGIIPYSSNLSRLRCSCREAACMLQPSPAHNARLAYAEARALIVNALAADAFVGLSSRERRHFVPALRSGAA